VRKENGGAVKPLCIFLLAFVVSLTLACSSPQDRAYEAEAKVKQEKLRLVQEYQKCLKEAGDNKAMKETCEDYLKRAETLK
jgi:hypothetical protein